MGVGFEDGMALSKAVGLADGLVVGLVVVGRDDGTEESPLEGFVDGVCVGLEDGTPVTTTGMIEGNALPVG